MFRVIRLTSRPLKKNEYNRIDIRKKKIAVGEPIPAPQRFVAPIIENVVLEQIETPSQENVDKVVAEAKAEVLDEKSELELLEEEKELAKQANEDVDEEQQTGNKNVLKMLFTSKKKKSDDEEPEEQEKRFSIWEELPDEPRDTAQLEAAEIINQDGYYDTILPIDTEEEHDTVSGGFNWKIPVILLGGILILVLLGIFMTKM